MANFVSGNSQWCDVGAVGGAARLNFGGARGLPAECLRARQGINLSMRLSLFFYLRFAANCSARRARSGALAAEEGLHASKESGRYRPDPARQRYEILAENPIRRVKPPA